MKNNSPYKKSGNLLTKTEADFYVYLKAAVNNDFHINKMTRMCDLVDVDKNLGNKEYFSCFRSISQYHIDFTLCDPVSFKPVICIELDDPSHERADRIKRDEKVNKIFLDINLPLLRIKTERTYNVENLRNLIDINTKSGNMRSSGEEGLYSNDASVLGNYRNIDRGDGMVQDSRKQQHNPKKIAQISALLLVIVSVVFMLSVLLKNAYQMIFKPTANATKSNISKQVYSGQKVPGNLGSNKSSASFKPSTGTNKKFIATAKNRYSLDDIKISTISEDQPSRQGNTTDKKEVIIRPNHYVGNFTVEMIWDGNYKSGDGVIALLDCGTKWLLVEQLASGIQLEHTVKKLTKGRVGS